MEKPATRASPEEGGNSVVSILIVVVLPAPLEPSKPKTSPALTARVTASTAVNAPKRRVRAWIARTVSIIGSPECGVNERNCGNEVLPPRGTNPRPAIRSDNLSPARVPRSEEHTSELQSLRHLVC